MYIYFINRTQIIIETAKPKTQWIPTHYPLPN